MTDAVERGQPSIEQLEKRIEQIMQDVEQLRGKDDELSLRERVALQEQLAELRKEKNHLLRLQGAVVATADQFSAFAKQVVEGVMAALNSDLFDQFAKQLCDKLEAEIRPVAALAPGAPDVDPGAGNNSSGNGSKDMYNKPGSRDGQPPGDERAYKQLRLSGSSGAGRGSHCLDHNRQAVLQAGAEFKQRLLHDSDLQRDLEAGFSASMVEFLRTPSGYKGLLGLDSPPSTIQLPSFLELLSQPRQEHAAMVIAAMAGARSGDDVSSAVDPA